MLNISENKIADKIHSGHYSVFALLEAKNKRLVFIRVLYSLLVFWVLVMFLPWTQNIQSKAFVTALKPSQRPQTIQSLIPGKIEKWYVQEGQRVNKGDTILLISEIKEQYLDPNLVEITRKQLNIKELSVKSYIQKIEANERQIAALLESQKLKYEQAQNKLKQAYLKITADSIDLIAAELNKNIAREQLLRSEELYKSGLKSLTELETRRLKYQETLSKYISQESKLLSSRNEVINARVELGAVQADYADKVSKSETEKFASISAKMDAENEVVKLQNQITNYFIRAGMYFILAPQDGYINKAIKNGVGETIKEGTEIITIIPAEYELAVEMFVDPIDIPLLELDQEVMIQFDGWPAIVFSGWPGTSFGTFSGRVVAIDRFTSAEGKYRVLVNADETDHPWPHEIRLGAGARTITLLKNVPVWYEIWRKINGFPPDYYKPTTLKTTK
ncbi:MAG TPA: biotin attachment protein [Bacteroidetes bacterium]|nr:biotin attachment protein [Bacteroidota bacterium]